MSILETAARGLLQAGPVITDLEEYRKKKAGRKLQFGS